MNWYKLAKEKKKKNTNVLYHGDDEGISGIGVFSPSESGGYMGGDSGGGEATAEDMIPGGLADKKDPDEFDQEQLTKGIRVELEHSDSVEVATEIAMDHLTEDSLYYEKLEQIHHD